MEYLTQLTPETVIFGGLTLVSLALVTLVWRISVRYSNHSSEMMKKNADAWLQNAKSQWKVSNTLENLEKLIKKLLKKK